MTLPVIPTRLFHGSSKPTIDHLDAEFSCEDNPFGPAIYLTEDLCVAGCYAQQRGCIYEVELQGDPRYTICLDQSLEDQTAEVIAAISTLLRHVGHRTPPVPHNNARETIDLADPEIGKRERNRMLRSLGIWLLYGSLNGHEMNGFCDRGVQFAVLHESVIRSQRYMFIGKTVEPFRSTWTRLRETLGLVGLRNKRSNSE